jgi:hypothetical protein
MGIVHGKHIFGDHMRTMAEFNHFHELRNFRSLSRESYETHFDDGSDLSDGGGAE